MKGKHTHYLFPPQLCSFWLVLKRTQYLKPERVSEMHRLKLGKCWKHYLMYCTFSKIIVNVASYDKKLRVLYGLYIKSKIVLSIDTDKFVQKDHEKENPLRNPDPSRVYVRK